MDDCSNAQLFEMTIIQLFEWMFVRMYTFSKGRSLEWRIFRKGNRSKEQLLENKLLEEAIV